MREDDIPPTHSHIPAVMEEHAPPSLSGERRVVAGGTFLWLRRPQTADERSSMLSNVTTDELSDSKIGRK